MASKDGSGFGNIIFWAIVAFLVYQGVQWIKKDGLSKATDFAADFIETVSVEESVERPMVVSRPSKLEPVNLKRGESHKFPTNGRPFEVNSNGPYKIRLWQGPFPRNPEKNRNGEMGDGWGLDCPGKVINVSDEDAAKTDFVEVWIPGKEPKSLKSLARWFRTLVEWRENTTIQLTFRRG